MKTPLALVVCLALAACTKKDPAAADAAPVAVASADTADAAVAAADDDAGAAPAASALATPAEFENKVAKTVDASAIDQQLDALDKQIAATPK